MSNIRPSHGANENSAFTIIELLIAIVIIGVLVAISTVAYSGLRDKAHHAATISQVTQIEKVIEINDVKNESVIVDGTDNATISRNGFLTRQGIGQLSDKVYITGVPDGYNQSIVDDASLYQKADTVGTVTTYTYDKNRVYVNYAQGSYFWLGQYYPYTQVYVSHWSNEQGAWIIKRIEHSSYDGYFTEIHEDGCSPAFTSCGYDSSEDPA